ncbi:MAG: hypothetical protein P8J20_09110 [Novosphingobium sp.]|nr:hypothetical protein [Novosphingobium sp.]
MSNETLVPIIIVGFFVAFSAMWLGITGLLGKMSGWSKLERAYPDHPEPPVEVLSLQSARIGVVGYNNCLRFEICATGLRISVMRLLGPFQRPFFVPWGQIKAQRRSRLFFKSVELNFGMRGEGKMAVRERSFERIAAIGNIRAD